MSFLGNVHRRIPASQLRFNRGWHYFRQVLEKQLGIGKEEFKGPNLAFEPLLLYDYGPNCWYAIADRDAARSDDFDHQIW